MDKERIEDIEVDEAPKKQKKKYVGLAGQVRENPVRMCKRLVSASETVMNPRLDVWRRHAVKYRRGLNYLQATTGGKAVHFTNYIFTNVETTKAHLSRNMPPIQVVPVGANDDMAATMLSRFLESQLQTARITEAQRAVVHNGLVATMGWFKVTYDRARGRNDIVSLHPKNVLVDTAVPHPYDGRWFIHKIEDMSVDEIYATYGVVPEPEETEANKDDESYFGSNRSDAFNRQGMLTSATNDAHGIGEMYDVYECWIRDFSEERENDWYIVTIAGNTVLHEEYSEYEHNQAPFIVWFAGEDYGADNPYYRGIGAIEEIEPLQDLADLMDMRLAKHISLTANRQKFVSMQAGLNPNLLDNTEGRTLLVNGDPSRAVFYDVPPAFSQDVYSYRGGIESKIQTVSGIFDVTQGRRPTGIVAGRAIESLKESADVRLVDLARSFSETLETVGYQVLMNSLQFFDGETVLKVMDADQEKQFMIVADYPEELRAPVDPLTGEPMLDEMGGALPITPEIIEAREQWRTQNNVGIVLSEIDYDYDVRISIESTLPTNKPELAQTLIELFRLGLIDRIAALQGMSFPNWNKVVERLEGTVTGKDAGQADAEWATTVQNMLMSMEQALAQMGVPPEVSQQLMQVMAESAQAGQEQQQPQTGNYQAQVV